VTAGLHSSSERAIGSVIVVSTVAGMEGRQQQGKWRAMVEIADEVQFGEDLLLVAVLHNREREERAGVKGCGGWQVLSWGR